MNDIQQELGTLCEELDEYYIYSLKSAVGGDRKPTKAENRRATELHDSIAARIGAFKDLITSASGIPQAGKEDIWIYALSYSHNSRTVSSLNVVIQAAKIARGRVESDIKMGRRHIQTGELLDKSGATKLETPKAFIAHEGETEQLNKLKDFLDSIGIEYFITETKASNGRSIERQVDWTQAEADFAICLATKGKAINKKTGKHYMGLNVADELGRARQVFKNKIILLVQKGVEVHTNTREIVYAPFTPQNMDMAFIKVIKELRNWGYIQVAKT